jgi:hypothetical protein
VVVPLVGFAPTLGKSPTKLSFKTDALPEEVSKSPCGKNRGPRDKDLGGSSRNEKRNGIRYSNKIAELGLTHDEKDPCLAAALSNG